MKRIIGFALFWVAVGIILALILPNTFFTFCLMAGSIAGGYYLFCGC